MGLATARHYGNIASDVRRFADSLRDAPADSESGRDGPGPRRPVRPGGGDAPAASDAQAKGEGHG